MFRNFIKRMGAAFQSFRKFILSPQGLFLIALFTVACIIRPEIAAIAAAVGAMILMVAASVGAAVAMIGISVVGIVAMLAIFPGCLLLPFLPGWLARRKHRKEMAEMQARIAQLEGKEKPPG